MSKPTEYPDVHPPGDAAVESRARVVFRNACDNADSYYALRLGLARRRALDARATRSAARRWAPLAGAAVACCALLVAVVLVRPDFRNASATRAAASAPIAAVQDDAGDELPEIGSSEMEIVQDLDFYRWLAAQPAGSAPAGHGR